MEYSWKFIHTLNSVFNSYNSSRIYNDYHSSNSFNDCSICNKLFVTDISSDEIEVPVFARYFVEDIIQNNLNQSNENCVDKIVIPLYTNRLGIIKKTTDSIINLFFTGTDFNTRLYKGITGKGDVYYGNKGIILDKNFNILFLCTIACKKIQYGDDQVMLYYKPIIRISSDLFMKNEEGLLHKAILKKIIPFYLSHDVSVTICHKAFINGLPDCSKPQILIEDINKFIETPIKPSVKNCSNAILNQILIDNVEDLMKEF